jgi:hypothetical protein
MNQQLSESTTTDETVCYYCGFADCRCDDYEDPDDEWACTFCGGEGDGEVDDPLWDECDEFGWGECSACGGTGLRKHQTVF